MSEHNEETLNERIEDSNDLVSIERIQPRIAHSPSTSDSIDLFERIEPTITNSPLTSTSATIIISNVTGTDLDLPLCRICWLDEMFSDLIELPCRCRGTMGRVHSTCLKEWENIRRGRRCEICKEVYIKKWDFLTVCRSFFQYKYAGVFCNKIMNITATSMIAYANIVLGQLNIAYLIAVERASSNRNSSSYPLIILSAAIFPYFIVNYLAVDFAMSEFIDCCNLFRDWWRNES